MRTEIRRVALAFALGFFVLTLGLAWWQVVRADQLANRAGNPRLAEAAVRAQRGTIYAADGTALGRSERGPDGRFRRIYSDPSLAQTLGYVSARYGVTGVEEALNDYLDGQRGRGLLAQIRQELARTPVRGNDVVLTIDPRVQQAAAVALGDRPGAVVALDPRSGAVLALVSSPGFDASAIDRDGEALLKDPRTPLLNRATQGQYPPGSTFKTVTAAAALESGTYAPDARFRCPSGFLVSGFVVACRGVPEGVQEYDFAHAYAWSINATFAEIAVRVGAPALVQTARRFGFESRIPFDIPLAPSRLLRPGSAFDPVLLASTGFGQGELAVTPLQMALVAAAVANDGVLMEPYLVQRVQRPDGTVLRERQPRALGQAVRPETAAVLRAFMVTAVREGFGGPAAVPGITVGGKTGTAETTTGRPTHAWFIGLAPAEQPRVAVAVIVEHGGQGSAVAAPIAQAVLRAALVR
jgi:peptidoglycan glycosyltransferase